jgi:(E)-4-hydroxy-3-methylbut-2-enyl-diphosphate synthase
MITRRKTRQINVGGVKIGGSAPVSIQSMTKVDTSDVKAVVSEIKHLESLGCEIIRVAVRNISDAEAVRQIKRKIRIPLACDIHFDYRLALECIRNGADKIRLNPGNIKRREEIREIIRAAKRANIPIRIGVNSGSVFQKSEVRSQKSEKNISAELVNAAMKYIRIFEEMDFHDIIVSLKASDVATTVEAYRKIAKLCDYPLHLGVTAAGPYDSGIVKSSVGIGALLLDGIGDTIRVSLTARPAEEVVAAKRILGAVGLRHFGPEIVSCPTCGRCQVDLFKIVNAAENALRTTHDTIRKSPLSIAIMGCEVNGPGEAKEADIGIAAGKKSGVLFIKGKIVRRIKEKNFVKEILKTLNTKL